MHPVLLRWISDDLDTATGDEVNGTGGAGTLPEDGVHDHAPRLKLDTFDLRIEEKKKEEERSRKKKKEEIDGGYNTCRVSVKILIVLVGSARSVK